MANVLTKLAEKIFVDKVEISGDYVDIKEDAFPINPGEFEKLPKTHTIRFYTISYTSDFEIIKASLHTPNQFAIININPLRERSTPIVVNILTKLKQIAKQIDGDIGALHNGWVILTPRHSNVYRKEKVNVERIVS